MITILLSASEPSGDALGAALMRALRAEAGQVRFIGGGGPLMRAEGLEGAISTEKLAVMGPADTLAAVPRAFAIAKDLVDLAVRHRPDAAVLIDSWTFSKALATRLRRKLPHLPLVKFGVPQVWASRPERAATAAALFDRLFCLLPFEPKHFPDAGERAVFVGNPNFQETSRRPRSGPSFRARHDIGDAPLLLILPGSRSGEVKRLLPVFGETLEELCRKIRGLRVAVIVAPAVEEKVRQDTNGWPCEPMLVGPEERFDAFDAGDVALAASGTVTTELALTGTPMVVTYKLGPLVAAWARRVVTTPYVTVLNVAAGDMVIPERLQAECEPQQLSADISRLLNDDEARRQQISAFRRLLPTLLGSRDAAEVAAEGILRLIDDKHR
ncbi:MAG: lipid-A-disaccharide synthase [Parvularcula sp.]|nr:lipid-A-disaccharide synthase [Parvularcula sp.]